jgi:hypothetical protein
MRMNLFRARVLGLLVLFAATAMPAAAQEKDVDVRHELTGLRKEIAELRAEITALKTGSATSPRDQQPTQE